MSDLDSLLRSTALKHGRISLDTMGDGRWTATVSHFDAHMSHPMGVDHGDPVDALRAALIEDERKCRELVRRYHAAPKAIVPDDMEDVLG